MLTLKSLFFGKKAANYQENDKLHKIIYEMFGGNSYVNIQEAKDYIRKGYMLNPHVYTVVNKIAKPASRIPFDVYTIKNQSKARSYKAAIEDKDFFGAAKYKVQAFELNEQSKLNQLIHNPNETQSFSQFFYNSLGYKLVTGNDYIYGLEPIGYEDGYFTKLYNMPSQIVGIKLSGNWQQPIEGYTVEPYFGNQIIGTKSVKHRKYFNPDFTDSTKHLFGLSPLSPLCNVVQRSNDSYLAALRLIQNGHPLGIMSSGTEEAQDPIEVKKLQDGFNAKYSGANNKGKIHFTNIQLQWQQLGLNSVDMQLLDSNKADLEDIARVYQVPLPLLQDEASTRDNKKLAATELWENAIMPELIDFRDSLNSFVTPAYSKAEKKELYIDFDLNGIVALKQDQKDQVDILAKEVEYGMISPNEARQILGYDISNIPQMDKFYINNKLKAIDELQEPKQ